jgi:hypothetical protein
VIVFADPSMAVAGALAIFGHHQETPENAMWNGAAA